MLDSTGDRRYAPCSLNNPDHDGLIAPLTGSWISSGLCSGTLPLRLLCAFRCLPSLLPHAHGLAPHLHNVYSYSTQCQSFFDSLRFCICCQSGFIHTSSILVSIQSSVSCLPGEQTHLLLLPLPSFITDHLVHTFIVTHAPDIVLNLLDLMGTFTRLSLYSSPTMSDFLSFGKQSQVRLAILYACGDSQKSNDCVVSHHCHF